MTGEHLVDRRPKQRECRRCRRIYLEGIDEGVPYRVDILPLSIAGELDALRCGRRTYAIQGDYVCHRNAMRMRGDARRGRPAILASHSCHEIVKPECYETGAVSEVQRMLRISARSDVPQREADGILAISETLNAVIIEPAPF